MNGRFVTKIGRGERIRNFGPSVPNRSPNPHTLNPPKPIYLLKLTAIKPLESTKLCSGVLKKQDEARRPDHRSALWRGEMASPPGRVARVSAPLEMKTFSGNIDCREPGGGMALILTAAFTPVGGEE